jgi:phage-related protein
MSTRKSLWWICSSKKDLKQMPSEVQDVFGYALDLAQNGAKHPDVKPLKGFGNAGVLEVVEDFDTNTYRAVYTAVLVMPFMFCTVFRRSRLRASKPRSTTSI